MEKTNYFENLTFSRGNKINVSDRIDPDFLDLLHWHPYTELLLSLSEGNAVSVNFTDYCLNTNDLVFVYSGTLHSVRPASDKSFLVIQFPLELLTIINNYRPLISILSDSPLISYNPASLDHNEIISRLSRIRTLQAEETRFFDASAYCLLLKVFMQIGSIVGEKLPSGTKTDAKNMDLIAEACLYISENCTQPLTLDETARHIGLSKSHFSHLFKSYTNMTFVEYLTAERIKQAESFFLDPGRQIVDVAFESGFTSLSSFNRSFRRIKGCSPTEFRQTRVD